ncbi:MAG TPA: nucleotidyltransferase domain-containing protein [Ktedonobacterales bacterium]|jgi:hypothetical protein
MARRSIEKAQRYQRGYAVLLSQISHLVTLAQQDPNVAAILLYGSLARLQPHLTSDVDLLVLCQEPQAFIRAPESSGQGMYMMVETTSPDEEWPLSPLVTDLGASDLPVALLNNIAQDGILLYQREGTTLPHALAAPIPYERWVARIEDLITRWRKREEPRLVTPLA